jgi:hypothetical protein
MPNPLEKNINDWCVIQVPPQSETDPRVPMAEEFALHARIEASNIWKSRLQQGWVSIPTIQITAPRTLVLSDGVALVPSHSNYKLEIAGSLEIPALSSSSSVIKRDDFLSLVVVATEFNKDHDPILGQVEFNYRKQQSDGSFTILPANKENSRRMRSVWVLVISSQPLTSEDFFAALPQNTAGNQILNIGNKTPQGFGIGELKVYALDTTLIAGKSYPVFKDSAYALPFLQIRRLQNFLEKGYVWGNGGEGNLAKDTHFSDIAELAFPPQTDNLVRQRALQIFSGIPAKGFTYSRTVQNLLAGNVSGNPGRPGEAASSPNGSVCLANDQRVSFTNQQIIQKLACLPTTAGSDGSGNAIVTFSLNSNAPLGTRFSQIRDDHKIYAADGSDQTPFGVFQNLGATGALTWIADSNSVIKPGNICYFVPGINFPSGSGFTVPFDKCEAGWANGVAIDAGNILDATIDDLASYRTPTANQEFIAVFGKERAALHYIYKKISVVSNGIGTVTIPFLERGVFAFIEGVSERINKPVVTGLTPNTTYAALVYYPPRSMEQWQWQFRYCFYQGLNNPTLLNNAEIISSPLLFVHTQGGGTSAFFGDSELQYSPIAMHLPVGNSQTKHYELNTPVNLPGENYANEIAFRELQAVPGTGCSLPRLGRKITFVGNTVNASRSLSGAIHLADGSRPLPIGSRLGGQVPTLSTNRPFQGVLCFGIQTNERKYLAIATINTKGSESLIFDNTNGIGFDIYNM